MKSISDYFTTSNKKNSKKDVELYEYFPREFISVSYNALYDEVKDIIQKNNTRQTAVCSEIENAEILTKIYSTINKSEWTPIIRSVKDHIETKFSIKIDYVLVQYYENGKSSIAWHNDKEALHSFVVSVSFGTSRKFSIRKISTKEVINEVVLIHGDLFYMKSGFQVEYEHCIVKETQVKEPRISLTFRQFN